MGDVISIEQLVWVCACGCSTLTAYSDGRFECAACEKEHDTLGAGWRDVGKCAFEGEPFNDVRGNGSVDFARRRVAQIAAADDVSMLAIARSNGTVHTWSDVENLDQLEWVKDKLQIAADLIEKRLR